MRALFFLIFCAVLIGWSNPFQAALNQEAGVVDYTKKPDDFWRKHLSPDVYRICRLRGTEPSHSGELDKNYAEGTYYCACCGGDFPVYKSEDKFNSGTGWPSFYQPIEGGIIERPDPDDESAFLGLRKAFNAVRTEVICKRCHSHLGHVFDDVPKNKGRRFCMNSLALTFVPKGKTPERIFENDE